MIKRPIKVSFDYNHKTKEYCFDAASKYGKQYEKITDCYYDPKVYQSLCQAKGVNYWTNWDRQTIVFHLFTNQGKLSKSEYEGRIRQMTPEQVKVFKPAAEKELAQELGFMQALPTDLRDLVEVHYETRLPLTQALNQPDIVLETIHLQKLGLKVINHAKLQPEFKQLILENYQTLLQLVGANELTITQATLTDWQKWLIQHWNHNWCRSPYSQSFYDQNDISWESKPENSLRLSDHWNFTTSYDPNEKHCVTTNPAFKTGWALARYQHGVYHIIKHFTNKPVIKTATT